MKIKTVVIKGIQRKLIKIDGIWVYKHHFCKCCGGRIIFNEYHKRYGISDFINGHQSIGENNSNWRGGFGQKRSEKRCLSKKRGLGFIELNIPSKEANSSHHLNREFVVWIPDELHRSIWHSVKTGKNMKEMNKLALKWCKMHDIELKTVEIDDAVIESLFRAKKA